MASFLPMLVTTAVVSYLLISTVLLGLVAVLDRLPFSDHLREQCWKWAMGLPLIIVAVQMATAVPQFAPKIVMRNSTVPRVAAGDHSVDVPNHENVSGRPAVRDDSSLSTLRQTRVNTTFMQTSPLNDSVRSSGAAGNVRVPATRPTNAGSAIADAVIPVARPDRRASSTGPAGAGTATHVEVNVNKGRFDHESRSNGWMAGSLLLALMSVVGVGVFVGEVLQHHRFLSHCRLLSEGTALSVLEQLLREQRVPHPVMLKSSVAAAEPAACGIRAWTIVLPTDLLDRFSADEWRVILQHELAHLQRRDPVWLLVGRLVASAFCWQPLNGWAVKRWQEAAELQCDASVVEAPARLLLARVLAALAEWKLTGQIRPRLSLTGSPLVRRVRRLLSVPAPSAAGRISGRMIAAAALTGGLLLAVISPRVTWANARPSLPRLQPPISTHAPAAPQGSRRERATGGDAGRSQAPSVIRQHDSPTRLTEEMTIAARELNALQADLSYAISLIQKSPRYSRLRPQARILEQRLQQLRASLPVE